MNNEQPNVGAGTKSCGVGTSVKKKSTERGKRLKIPPVYSFRGIRAYDELQTVATEVGQVKQVDI